MSPARFLTLLAFVFCFTTSAYALDPITQKTDTSGDGYGDLITYDSSNALFTLRNSTTGAFSQVALGNVGDVPVRGDFNGDDRGDLATFNRSTGVWNVLISGGTGFTATVGGAGDVPVAADYDGLGCTQLATYNRALGVWTIANCSGQSARTVNFC